MGEHDCLHAVASPAVTKRVIGQFTRMARPGPPEGLDDLTAREREILLLIANGLSNAEIGRELYIGETTVKTHDTHVLQKLGLPAARHGRRRCGWPR